MNEPEISINGTLLSTGQAMTIRVALEMLAMDLDEDGLGDDQHSKIMTRGYQERIQEIRKLVYGG